MDIKQVCETTGATGVVQHYFRGRGNEEQHAIWLQFSERGFSGIGTTAEAALFNAIADAKKYGVIPAASAVKS